MSEFWEAYKHPLWQEKRLRIMERERFSCERCGASGKTLNVHHAFYERGKKPWEYDDRFLHCWCEECHDDFHTTKTAFCVLASQLGCEEVQQAISYLRAMVDAASASETHLLTDADAKGWCDFWGIREWEQFVARAVDERDARDARASKSIHSTISESTDGPAPPLERQLIEIILGSPHLYLQALASVQADMLTHPGLRKVYSAIILSNEAGDRDLKNLQYALDCDSLYEWVVEHTEIGKMIPKAEIYLQQVIKSFRERISSPIKDAKKELGACKDANEATAIFQRLQERLGVGA